MNQSNALCYDLRHNYNNVYINAVLPLLNSNNSVQSYYNIIRVVRKKKNHYFCELNINYSSVYKWINENELTLRQKNLLLSPRNYNQIINSFISDFKKNLIKALTKTGTGNIKLRLKLNEEVFKKFIANVNLNVSERNSKYFDISQENFSILFKFNIENILLSDHTNQSIRPSFPIYLKKPRFTIRENKWYKTNINNNLETIYFTHEFINFIITVKSA
jgi:hypothetical protein